MQLLVLLLLHKLLIKPLALLLELHDDLETLLCLFEYFRDLFAIFLVDFHEIDSSD